MAKKLTVPKVKKALMDNEGLILYSARDLGCSRNTLYSFIRKHPELQEIIDEAKYYLVEFSESILRQHIRNNNLNAAMFALKTLGGWSEKVSIRNGPWQDVPDIPLSPEVQKLGIEYLRKCTEGK